MDIVYRGILECEDIMLVLAFKKACDIKKCRAIDENLYYIEIDTDSRVFQENRNGAPSLEFHEYFQRWIKKNPQFLAFDKAARGNMEWTGLDNYGVYKHTSYSTVKADEGNWRSGTQFYYILYSDAYLFSTYTNDLTVSMYLFWEDLADGIVG